jgi:hypothetical protein
MSSEIKVDTISENTSANGVAIDSLGIKDGKITNLMNATLSAADLGSGIHIKTADSGASASTAADDLVIEQGSSGNGAGLSILSATDDTCNIFFGDSGDNDAGMIQYNHADNTVILKVNGNTNHGLRIDTSNNLSTNAETSVDTGVGGLCLNQGANDNNILTFKSSDVAHGITDFAETDTYGHIVKNSAGSGGLKLHGFMETISAIVMRSFHVNENTTQAASGADAAMIFDSCVKNGTTVTGNNDAANMVMFRDNTTPRVFICGDGDIFTDTNSFTAFDTYEDAQLVRALDLSMAPKASLIDSKFDEFINYNAETLANVRILGKNEDGTPSSFLNIQGLQRLHNGAIWQQYEKHQKLANAMYELAKAAVGEDKANEILEQNEIKLLN